MLNKPSARESCYSLLYASQWQINDRDIVEYQYTFILNYINNYTAHDFCLSFVLWWAVTQGTNVAVINICIYFTANIKKKTEIYKDYSDTFFL